jgi:two-component sensor histidine kinase
MYMRTERFLELLGSKVDSSRRVRWALIDRDGRYIARSDEHGRFVGTELAPHLLALSSGIQGIAESIGVNGAPVVRAFRRSPSTGWVMAVSIPTAIVYAEMRQAWAWFLVAGLLLSGSAAYASYRVAIRLKSGLARLGDAAGRIGRGPLPDDPSLDVREFARIYANMQTSGREIATLGERRDVLLRELVHRSRNMLTVVLSVVHSAFRQYARAAEAKEAIIGRISALALANELVTDDHDPIDLRMLINRSIDAFAYRQFSVDGPTVLIGEETAQRAALLIHELCTNAAKYGALATEGGHVLIRWFHPPEDPDTLVFTWTETGGPPVAEPTRRGYGTRLILASAFDPDQPPTLDFEPFGFRLRMVTPVAALVR